MNKQLFSYFSTYFLVIVGVSIFCFFLQKFSGVGYMSELYNQGGFTYYTPLPWQKFTLYGDSSLNLGFLEKIFALAIILFPLHMASLNKSNSSLKFSLTTVVFLWLALSIASDMNVFGYTGSGGGVVSFSSMELYSFTLLPALVLAWLLSHLYLRWHKIK